MEGMEGGEKDCPGALPLKIPNTPPQPLRLGDLRHRGSHNPACWRYRRQMDNPTPVTWPADEAGARLHGN